MEAWNFQKWHGKSASWRPRRAYGLLPVWVWRLRTRKQWCSSSLKASGPKILEQLMVPYESKGRKKVDVPVWRQSSRKILSYLGRRSLFLLYSGLQLIGWGSPTLGRAICLSHLISSPNTFTETPRIMLDWISGQLVAQSNWHIELTITFSFCLSVCYGLIVFP